MIIKNAEGKWVSTEWSSALGAPSSRTVLAIFRQKTTPSSEFLGKERVNLRV